jgi:ribokinase
LLAVIREAGVDCAAVRVVPDCPTGRGIITLAEGENTIVVIPGANMLLEMEQVEQIDFQPGDICVAQLETPIEATAVAFRRARESGASTLFNPAPASEVPAEVLELSDVLVVNVHEFTATFGVAIDDCLAAEDLPDAVTRRFSGSLLATLGAAGVSVWQEGTRARIPGHPVSVVDSTGAGDCFVGYLTAGLVSGLSLELAARRANRAAAIGVTRHGALTSIPFAGEVPS